MVKNRVGNGKNGKIERYIAIYRDFGRYIVIYRDISRYIARYIVYFCENISKKRVIYRKNKKYIGRYIAIYRRYIRIYREKIEFLRFIMVFLHFDISHYIVFRYIIEILSKYRDFSSKYL